MVKEEEGESLVLVSELRMLFPWAIHKYKLSKTGKGIDKEWVDMLRLTCLGAV